MFWEKVYISIRDTNCLSWFQRLASHSVDSTGWMPSSSNYVRIACTLEALGIWRWKQDWDVETFCACSRCWILNATLNFWRACTVSTNWGSRACRCLLANSRSDSGGAGIFSAALNVRWTRTQTWCCSSRTATSWDADTNSFNTTSSASGRVRARVFRCFLKELLDCVCSSNKS